MMQSLSNIFATVLNREAESVLGSALGFTQVHASFILK